jgi:hypothetical protein
VDRTIPGSDDADDARSNNFLVGVSAYPGLSANANAEAWLVTIAPPRGQRHHPSRQEATASHRRRTR